MPVELGSMYLGGSMPRRADTRVAMQDKVNVTDYNSLSFRWAVVGLVLTLPFLFLRTDNAQWCNIV